LTPHNARIITGLLLGPLAIAAILLLGSDNFGLASLLLMLLAGWEWARLIGWQSTPQRLLFPLILLLLAAAIWQFGPVTHQPIMIAAALWWLLALITVLRFGAADSLWHRSAVARGLAGVATLIPFWLALWQIHATRGAEWVIILLVVVWSADSGAYFAGRRFGRRKLAPQVSPGKSWEGATGGLLMTLLIALPLGHLWPSHTLPLSAWLLLLIVLVIFSIVGDLSESLFKRIAGVKDSGTLLPGHGGILDRFDSLTAVAPLAWLGIVWLA
jgi:phosphatidate cytidylyltransferase